MEEASGESTPVEIDVDGISHGAEIRSLSLGPIWQHPLPQIQRAPPSVRLAFRPPLVVGYLFTWNPKLLPSGPSSTSSATASPCFHPYPWSLC